MFHRPFAFSPGFAGRALLAGAVVPLVLLLQAVPANAGTAGQHRHHAAATSVYVIQGVLGTTVGVTIDGKTVSSALAEKGISGPVDLGRGEHSVQFTSDDWTVSKMFQVDHSSMDVVLHWPADKTAKPVVTVYTNDLRPVPADTGRITVAHTAVVPPADVRVDGKVVFANIANGEFITAEVPAGTYSVDIVPTGQHGNPVFGPVDLPVKADALTRVFAVGAPKNNGMDAVVQTFPLQQKGSPRPTQVDAGAAGLVSPGMAVGLVGDQDNARGSGRWVDPSLVLAGIATVLLVTGGAGFAAVRPRRRDATGP